MFTLFRRVEPTKPATERKEQAEDQPTTEDEVYEKPQLHPQDGEREGDFWCD